MELIQFPNNKPLDEETPVGMLKAITAALIRGDIDCDQMIITWCKQEEGTMSMGFKVAGDESLTSAIGLLELTKSTLME